jgi:uncharacterized protein (DUF1778 family)
MYGKSPYTTLMPRAAKSKPILKRTLEPSRSRRAESRAERKTARMELRLTPSSKKVIERAVALSGLAPSELAYEAARRVLEDHERFVLRDADQEVFFRAISAPPAPASRLVDALRRHRRTAR